MGNFDFVRAQWPGIAEAASRSEASLRGDPRTSAMYARRAAEQFTDWIYTAEHLPRPTEDSFANLTHQREFHDAVTPNVSTSLRLVRLIGNDAVHKEEALPLTRARSALEQLHLVLRWLHHTYGDLADATPSPFSFDAVPPAPATIITRARADLERMQQEFDVARRELAAQQQQNAAIRAELDALRAQYADLKATNAEVNLQRGIPDPTLATEAETRTALIDILLHEAGWKLDDPRDREWPLTGIPTPSGTGRADYVLWGDDGRPLAVIEAKRTRKSAAEGRVQAQAYADALERDFGQRPLIFYTNGYEHWLWDDRRYAPRRVAGFLTKDELLLAIQRRTTRRDLVSTAIDRTIVERPYQLRAIRAVSEAFEQQRRRALLVMATGTGKTRTVIALVDVLQRANWVKRVLFLADRTALVAQAVGAFKAHLPDSAPVNLLTDRDADSRVYVSTYQTAMGIIDAGEDEVRRFGPGFFDLIVVDEAHRSIYNRYGEIFDYFDALVVGLTATPRADIDHNTYRMFQLDDGVPTDAYELDEAIESGYLVPPVARVLDLGFLRRGIRYADLPADEREQWDALEWHGGDIPDEIDAAAMNRWLFNEDTVDRVLEDLMTSGRRVAGGARIGKTIVFAKNQHHAEFIADRFDANYPERKGTLAEVITHATGPYVQSRIDAFSAPASAPDIAISVDMLDTGIDIPEVVNLVFFKPVHSHTKYWQMIGRGTRLRPDLYGPGEGKSDFLVIDVCGNIEYFNADITDASPGRSPSLGERLFVGRARLLALLASSADPAAEDLRAHLATSFHARISGMNQGNVLVRKHLRTVDRFSTAAPWNTFTSADVDAAAELAPLPSAVDADDTDEAARRFDALVLEAELAVAADAPVPGGVIARVAELVRALGDRRGIPAVDAQAELLAAVGDPDWWLTANLSRLEQLRVRLRGLVRLAGRDGQRPLHTNFTDTLAVRSVEMSGVASQVDRAAFRARLLGFLGEHSDDVALHKLRTGRALTVADLEQLEEILRGAVDPAQLSSQAVEAGGLGRLIRSIVGLERSAAEAALSEFVSADAFTVRQHAFVDLVVQQLTIGGYIDPRRLYEDPFTGLAPDGPDALFTDAQVTDLIDRLRRLDSSADPVSEPTTA